jgi:hypothetical protein
MSHFPGGPGPDEDDQPYFDVLVAQNPADPFYGTAAGEWLNDIPDNICDSVEEADEYIDDLIAMEDDDPCEWHEIYAIRNVRDGWLVKIRDERCASCRRPALP